MPDDVAYDEACLDIVKTGYREYVCDGAMSTIPSVRSSDPLPRNPDESAQTTIPRRTRITPKDISEHGYTVGCQGCEAIQLGHAQRRNHSEVCRKRLEEAMEKSEVGKDRLQRTKERMDFRTAQVGEDIMEQGEMNTEKNLEVKLNEGIVDDGINEDMQGTEVETETELQEMPGSSTDKRFLTPQRELQSREEAQRHSGWMMETVHQLTPRSEESSTVQTIQ